MRRSHKWQLVSALVIFRTALITSFRSESEISPDQISRDSEGILTGQEYQIYFSQFLWTLVLL